MIKFSINHVSIGGIKFGPIIHISVFCEPSFSEALSPTADLDEIREPGTPGGWNEGADQSPVDAWLTMLNRGVQIPWNF